MKNSISQKGSLILYAMLTMSVMLAIGLSLNSLFLNKFKSAMEQRNSVVAIYAADSATELCLYEARSRTNDPTLSNASGGILENSSTFQIENTVGQADVTLDCSALGSSSFSFRASGNYRGVRRTLEVSQ